MLDCVRTQYAALTSLQWRPDGMETSIPCCRTRACRSPWTTHLEPSDEWAPHPTLQQRHIQLPLLVHQHLHNSTCTQTRRDLKSSMVTPRCYTAMPIRLHQNAHPATTATRTPISNSTWLSSQHKLIHRYADFVTSNALPCISFRIQLSQSAGGVRIHSSAATPRHRPSLSSWAGAFCCSWWSSSKYLHATTQAA